MWFSFYRKEKPTKKQNKYRLRIAEYADNSKWDISTIFFWKYTHIIYLMRFLLHYLYKLINKEENIYWRFKKLADRWISFHQWNYILTWYSIIFDNSPK